MIPCDKLLLAIYDREQTWQIDETYIDEKAAKRRAVRLYSNVEAHLTGVKVKKLATGFWTVIYWTLRRNRNEI
jgi:hypothetical protein